MKRIFALLCAVALLASLAACSGKETAAPADPLASMSLQAVLEASLKDVPDLPKYEAAPLDADSFEFFAFVPYEEGFEGLQADALIGSIAHSVVLLRVPEDKAEKTAAAVKQNANPRKWICTEAEKVVVDRCGGTILLAMTAGETANAILTNFKALYGAVPSEDELALPEPFFPEDFTPGGTEVVTFPDPDDVTLGEEDALPAAGEAAIPEAAEAEPPAAAEIAPPATAETAPPAAAPVEEEAAPAVQEEEPAELSQLLSAVLSGAVSEELSLAELELDADNFEFFAFIPCEAGWRGIVSEPMIGSIAHSVVLLELPTEADAARAAAAMQANADPRKWICVEAEEVRAASSGRYALLVMTGPNQADIDAIFANFNGL